MGIIRLIKRYYEKSNLERLECLEKKQRNDEFGQMLDRIVNIDLFGRNNVIQEEIVPKKEKKSIEKYNIETKTEILNDKKRQKELSQTLDRIMNINIINPKQIKEIKKINIIDKIHPEKMTADQLKNTYSCIKKSIKQAETRNKLDDIEELKQLKVQVKKILLEKSNNLDFNSIKYNILYGDVNKLDYYREYLLGCYEHYKNIQHNNEAHQMRITILTLLKLIERKKQKFNNNQYVKKVA